MTTVEIPERFGRNTVSSLLLSAVMVVVALAVTPLLTRYLGHERYGIWVLVLGTVQYLELLELGLAGAAVTYLARQFGAGDHTALERTLNTSFFALAGLGVVAFAIAIGIAAFLPSLVHVQPALVTTTRELVVLLGLDIIVSIPMDTFGGGLIALQRFDLLNATLIAVTMARAVAWTLVLVAGGRLLALGIVTVSLGLAGQVARFVLLRRQLPHISVHPRNFDRNVLRSLARPAGWFALGSFVSNFRDYARVLVLGIVRNVATAGVFAVGESLATFGLTIQGPATQQFFPHAAALVGRGDPARLRETTITGTRFATAATMPLCVVVAVFARPALVAWVGPSFAGAAVAATLIACAFGLSSIAKIPRLVMSGSGEQRLPALVGLAAGVVDIGLTAALGFEFGITGVAVACVISTVVIDLGTTPLVCRRLGVSIAPYLLSVVRGHLLPIVVAGGLGSYLSVGPVSSFVAAHGRFPDLVVVAGTSLVVLIVYGAVFSVTGLDSDERHSMVSHLRRPQ